MAKATALAFALIKNHPFLDGNKRVGHAAMETFLRLNGLELDVPVDSAEAMVLGIASGRLGRSDLEAWTRKQVITLRLPPPAVS